MDTSRGNVSSVLLTFVTDAVREFRSDKFFLLPYRLCQPAGKVAKSGDRKLSASTGGETDSPGQFTTLSGTVIGDEPKVSDLICSFSGLLQ